MEEDQDEFVTLEPELKTQHSSNSGGKGSRSREPTSYEKASNFLTNSVYMIGGLLTNPLKSKSEQYYVLGQRKESQAECLAVIKQTIWITYRKNFPELMESKYISDTGWGCMIRVGQMLLASALRRYQRLHYGQEQADITTILTSFLDDDESKGTSINYSIQKIVKIGHAEFKLPPGSWLTPSHITYILEQLHNTNPLRGYEGMKILAFNNNTLFYEQVLNMLGYNVCRCKPVVLRCPKCHAKPPDRNVAILLLLLSRIGLDAPQPDYREVVMKMLEMKQFVGMIGGKPKKALFFLGHEEKKELIYLDPHYVQESVTRKNLETMQSTFSCDSYRTIDYHNIDPSLGFGFLINDLDDLQDLHSSISAIIATHKQDFFMFSDIQTPGYVKQELKEEFKQSSIRANKIKQMFQDRQDPEGDGDSDFGTIL